jgi:hypothetical protein
LTRNQFQKHLFRGAERSNRGILLKHMYDGRRALGAL